MTYGLFGSKTEKYDADGIVKMLDTNIPRFDGKGYCTNYFLDCPSDFFLDVIV